MATMEYPAEYATKTPTVPIPEESKLLYASVNEYVRKYMSSEGHDSSHDYMHILRVTSQAKRLLEAETQAHPILQYDALTIFLSVLVHDVGDHKYAKPGEDVENQISNILIERGASTQLALKVQKIAKHVSCTNEMRNPGAVKAVLEEIPELAIVQDADRLDALGATGAARVWAYQTAKRHMLQRAVDYFEILLYPRADLMKTTTGKQRAREYVDRLRTIKSWWEEETEHSFGME